MDELVAGFLTTGPVTQGHALLLPKNPVVYLSELVESIGQHLFAVAQRTALAIKKSGLKCEGINLFLADGEAGFLEILHLHTHVFPRFKGGYFQAGC